MAELFIPVIIGTSRPKRKSYFAAKFIKEVGERLPEIKTILIDPTELDFKTDGNDPENKIASYSDITARADGFFIVTPEYNHSFPGSLKRMLDSEYENYHRKAVAFGGVSNGSWGGVRAIEALVLTTRTLGLSTINRDIQFPRVQDIFDDQGNLMDESYVARAEKVWQDLIWLAQALKQAR